MNPQRTVAVPLVVAAVPLDIARGESVGCLSCGQPLELHQPSIGDPDRLIGICHGRRCQERQAVWHLIDVSAVGDGLTAMVLQLPSPAKVEAACGQVSGTK